MKLRVRVLQVEGDASLLKSLLREVRVMLGDVSKDYDGYVNLKDVGKVEGLKASALEPGDVIQIHFGFTRTIVSKKVGKTLTFETIDNQTGALDKFTKKPDVLMACPFDANRGSRAEALARAKDFRAFAQRVKIPLGAGGTLLPAWKGAPAQAEYAALLDDAAVAVLRDNAYYAKLPADVWAEFKDRMPDTQRELQKYPEDIKKLVA